MPTINQKEKRFLSEEQLNLFREQNDLHSQSLLKSKSFYLLAIYEVTGSHYII